MGFVKLLLNFYVNSSIHVAVAVYSLVRITESYFQLSYNENLDYFIFYATITGYNFVKYAGVAKFYHRSLTKSMRLIQVFSFLCFCLLVYYGSKLSTDYLALFYSIWAINHCLCCSFFRRFSKKFKESELFENIFSCFCVVRSYNYDPYDCW